VRNGLLMGKHDGVNAPPVSGTETSVERMHSDSMAAAPVQAVFASARQFGLDDDEVLRTFDQTLWTVGEDATMSEYLDELSGTLAKRILAKERRRSARGR
jgi:hypothetical protein